MIKSELGLVEIKGFKPVVMAEFSTLLSALKNSLGEADYNRVLQDANDSKQLEDEPEDSDSKEKETAFEPHLLFEFRGVHESYGRIGDETEICDIAGRKLSVGDVVNLYSIEDNGRLDFRGEHSIVRDNDSEFVMGVKGHEFDRGVSNSPFEWVIILNRRHTEVEDGETVDGIKYIKSERTGK